MKVTVIDYGLSNLLSVQHAFAHFGAEVQVTSSPADVLAADALVLPGVGAFQDGMQGLEQLGLIEPIKQKTAQGTLLLGICLGMQMLFERSFEFGETEGLGLIPGSVRLLDAGGLKIPHMGWNDLTVLHPCELTGGTKTGDYVYFVHSFCADTPEENISCHTVYGERVPALVCRGSVYGAQFHPEKSGEVGLNMLKNFARLCQ